MTNTHINVGGHKITTNKQMTTGTFSGTGTNPGIEVRDTSTWWKKDNNVFITIAWKANGSLTDGTTYSASTNIPDECKPLAAVAVVYYSGTRPFNAYFDTSGNFVFTPRTSGISGHSGSLSFSYMVSD